MNDEDDVRQHCNRWAEPKQRTSNAEPFNQDGYEHHLRRGGSRRDARSPSPASSSSSTPSTPPPSPHSPLSGPSSSHEQELIFNVMAELEVTTTEEDNRPASPADSVATVPCEWEPGASR